MYHQLKNLSEYSVNREQKQYYFKYLVYLKQQDYLKFNNLDYSGLVDPLKFNELKFDENKFEIAHDVSEIYSVGLEEEKVLIKNRAANLNYLRHMTQTFENCRSICKLPDSRFRNIHFSPKNKQMCLTDCMNVNTENNIVNKPLNDEKAFIWLA